MGTWEPYIRGYRAYLQLEKSLSAHSVDAYTNDIRKLVQYFEAIRVDVPPQQVEPQQIRDFIAWINGLGLEVRSQARIISGIKGFFNYLILENEISHNPAALIEAPRLSRKLPQVLTIQEIDQIMEAIDLSKSDGHRNRAMIETLYGCGLRVSELV
ncbi:MAG: site-specific integrase, partial [Bacteroidales bacterium]|nr:site-specific integrase [Bacteroidales bacterium]